MFTGLIEEMGALKMSLRGRQLRDDHLGKRSTGRRQARRLDLRQRGLPHGHDIQCKTASM